MKYVPNTSGLTIKAKNGEFKDFAGLALMGQNRPVLTLLFGNGKSVECTLDHEFMTPMGRVPVSELNLGDEVYMEDGTTTMFVSVEENGFRKDVFDVINVDGDRSFAVNGGIMSSNCAFVTDEETLIDPMCLSRLRSEDPAYYTQQVRWFCEPHANHGYMVALDPSLGTGGDYSAIQVFMLPELIQVAEWQHNQTDVRGQVRTLLQILYTLYEELSELPDQHGEPDIYWTVENNSVGEAILQVIADTGIERFPGMIINERKKRGSVRKFRKGLTTTNASKLSSCARLKSLVESDRLILQSNQTIKELKGFVRRGASYSAKPGQHDDLVSALLLITRMLDIIIAMGMETSEDLKEGIAEEDIWNEPPPIVV